MKKNSIQIIIDPSCNLHYSAFYVLGLRETFLKNVKFSHQPFQQLKDGRATCFLFIVLIDRKPHKVAIDFHDANTVNKEVMLWCDVYAKINYHHQETLQDIRTKFEIKESEKHQQKLLSIPPSFGVNIFSLAQLMKFCIDIAFADTLSLADKKATLSGALRMFLKRKKTDFYKPQPSQSNYVFHISSIWDKDAEHINYSRANFIRACKEFSSINFEGGLVDIGYDYTYMGNLEDVLYSGGKIGLEQYIKKTRVSRMVFNGPSVLKCHGWKLAEYLSLGKAIISTPLHNDLPVPLTHGENIHFIEDNKESMINAIQYLLENPDYVKKLEQGALIYWSSYVQPSKVIERIINFAKHK